MGCFAFLTIKPAAGSRSGPHWGAALGTAAAGGRHHPAHPAVPPAPSWPPNPRAGWLSGCQRPKTSSPLLVCTAGEQPGFVLLTSTPARTASGWRRCLRRLPSPLGRGEATLAQCYAAAGPARCREALLGPLALPETTRYLALSPSVLAAIADRYGMLRVGFSGALTADELAQCGFPAGAGSLGPGGGESLSGWDKDGTLPPSHRAAARAAVWDAFFRQDLELLPRPLPCRPSGPTAQSC